MQKYFGVKLLYLFYFPRKLYKDIIEPFDLFKNNLTCIFDECLIEMKNVKFLFC